MYEDRTHIVWHILLKSLSLPFSLKLLTFRTGKQKLQMSSEASQKNTVDEFISSNPKPAGPDISDLMMDQLCLSPEKLVGSQLI